MNFKKLKKWFEEVGTNVIVFLTLWVVCAHGICVLVPSLLVGFLAYGSTFTLHYSLFIVSASFVLSTPMLLLVMWLGNRLQEDFYFAYLMSAYGGGMIASVLLIVINLGLKSFTVPNPLFGAIFVPVFAVSFALLVYRWQPNISK